MGSKEQLLFYVKFQFINRLGNLFWFNTNRKKRENLPNGSGSHVQEKDEKSAKQSGSRQMPTNSYVQGDGTWF